MGMSHRIKFVGAWLAVLAGFVLLTACSGGGEDDTPAGKTEPPPRVITGSGVKGPLVGADVSVYEVDMSQPGFKHLPFISTGVTDSRARLYGVALPLPLNPPYFLEISSNAGTLDITTQQIPVLSVLRTVITREMLDAGQHIYATPLTTLAVDLAIANADSDTGPYAGNNDGSVTTAEFLAALQVAAKVVTSTFGFGMTDVDIFTTAPLFDTQVTTEAQMNATAAYRAAIESLIAVLGQVAQTTGASHQESFESLLADLVDGAIDDADMTSAMNEFDPATTPIPNTQPPLTPDEVKQILIDETVITNDDTTPPAGWQNNPPPWEPPVSDSDVDADGVLNVDDNCPRVPNSNQEDLNNNLIGDVCENIPVATADGIAVSEGASVSILQSGQASVLDNDTDADSDSLTAELIAGPQRAGSFILNPDGTFTYTHDGSELETSDSFTYRASDGVHHSETVTVSITITLQDDPAVLTTDSNTVTEDSAVNTVVGNVLANDTDPDTSLEVIAVAPDASYGSLAIQTNGDYVYTLDNNNPAVNALNAGDTLTEVFTYQVTGDASSTLTIIIQGANDVVIPPADLSGIWKTSRQITAQQDLVTNGCALAGTVEFDAPSYFSMTQSGSQLTLLSVIGGVLTGAMTSDTEFQFSGVNNWPLALNNTTKTITSNAAGQINNDGSLSVTVTNIEAIGGQNLCRIEYVYTAEFVYEPNTSAQSYSGLYADEYVDTNGNRESQVFQIEVTQDAVNFQGFPILNPAIQFTVLNNTYDPATGFFQVEYRETENNDADGSSEFHATVNGMFVRAPDDDSGLPILSTFTNGYSRHYDGPDQTGTVIGGNYEIGVGYSKRVSPSGFGRSVFLQIASGINAEGIFVGMNNPPVASLSGNDAYLEVLNTSGDQLCSVLYSLRYQIIELLPYSDMSAETFHNGPYSYIACNTTDYSNTENPVHRITDGSQVTLRIMDTGVDGQIGGGDDVLITSLGMTVNVADSFFNRYANVNDFALDNGSPSHTLKNGSIDGMVDFFGYVDISEDLSFSWNPVPGAENYQVRLIDTEEPNRQRRIIVNGQTTSVTLPAESLGDGENYIQVIAAKQDVNNSAIATALSKKLIVYAGVKGLFNVEWGDVGPFEYHTFQLALTGPVYGDLSECFVVNNPHLACLGGSVNSFNGPNSGNIITLNLEDLSGHFIGQSFTLFLNFDDAANGYVGFDFPTTIPLTDVRAVQPELNIRSIRWSDDSIESRVIISNTLGTISGGLFDQAIFKVDDNSILFVGGLDTGVNAVNMWTDLTDFANKQKHFIQFPTIDGSAQGNGHYLRWNTNREWGLGLGLLAGTAVNPVRYNAVLTSTADAQLKWVFKKDYNGPDPSSYVAPRLSDISVQFSETEVIQAGIPAAGGQGVIGDADNPIPVTNPNFTITWTGSTAANGQWQFRGTDVITSVEVRTPWLDAGDSTLTDHGDGTWSWTEAGGVNLYPGQIVRFEIRTRDANNTVMGAQRVDHRLHLLGVATP